MVRYDNKQCLADWGGDKCVISCVGEGISFFGWIVEWFEC